jgi:hypothetical protein
MIRGRFGNTSGCPYIEGRVVIPRLKVAGNVSFIADTGADETVLMPIDAGRLAVNFNILSNASVSLGVGGLSRDHLEPAIVYFREAGVCFFAYYIDLRISTPSPYNLKIYSLLGRNIMDNWSVVFDKPNNTLHANVTKLYLLNPAE